MADDRICMQMIYEMNPTKRATKNLRVYSPQNIPKQTDRATVNDLQIPYT